MVILEGLTHLPPKAQSLLLRLIDALDPEHRPRRAAAHADLRIVAISGDDLESALQSGRLRADPRSRTCTYTRRPSRASRRACPTPAPC